ncbi:MAG: acyl-CoA reductase [Bacteroidota bacterium]
MTLKQRTEAFTRVGLFITRYFEKQADPAEIQLHQGLDKLIETAQIYNGWFIPKFVNEAIFNVGLLLEEKALTAFTKDLKEPPAKTVAIICAGNIPMVCFHDVLCVLLSGHKAMIKLSSDDNILLPFFLKLLCFYEPRFEEKISFADGRLGKFDAIIATGSDNTASHLHYYFGKYPNIIRKSRTSVAVLSGNETAEDLQNLARDVFTYFGLGCRNVSKIFVPQGYSLDVFFEAIIDFSFVVNNKKYGNNYDYHRAIYLLESIPFLDNNFLMLRESADLYSPVGVLFYQFYKAETEVKEFLEANKNHIQCVVGASHIPFGYSQQPVITDFADQVNTLDFLVNL